MGLIFLTGMPGVGKTTVGGVLAEQLGWTFTDLDAMIVLRTGRSIPEIFTQHGEPFFRDIESDLLVEAFSASGAVIALGAGALEREENARRVKENGTLIYLRADLDLLTERNLQAPGRPLLDGARTKGQLRSRLAELLTKREHNYLSAPIIVDVNPAQTPEEIAAQILALLRRNERV